MEKQNFGYYLKALEDGDIRKLQTFLVDSENIDMQDEALNTPNTTKQHSFILSKALINESLEFPFSIECEGYIETIKDNLFDKSQDLSHNNTSPIKIA